MLRMPERDLRIPMNLKQWSIHSSILDRLNSLPRYCKRKMPPDIGKYLDGGANEQWRKLPKLFELTIICKGKLKVKNRWTLKDKDLQGASSTRPDELQLALNPSPIRMTHQVGGSINNTDRTATTDIIPMHGGVRVGYQINNPCSVFTGAKGGVKRGSHVSKLDSARILANNSALQDKKRAEAASKDLHDLLDKLHEIRGKGRGLKYAEGSLEAELETIITEGITLANTSKLDTTKDSDHDNIRDARQYGEGYLETAKTKMEALEREVGYQTQDQAIARARNEMAKIFRKISSFNAEYPGTITQEDVQEIRRMLDESIESLDNDCVFELYKIMKQKDDDASKLVDIEKKKARQRAAMERCN
jgi:hypothetical protein